MRLTLVKALGLDDRAYAGMRMDTGHGLVAFLFSSDAVRVSMLRLAMSEYRVARLADPSCGQVALVVSPVTPGVVPDSAHAAPYESLQGLARRGCGTPGKLLSDPVILVGDLGFERDWSAAWRLAGYLPAMRYSGTLRN